MITNDVMNKKNKVKNKTPLKYHFIFNKGIEFIVAFYYKYYISFPDYDRHIKAVEHFILKNEK